MYTQYMYTYLKSHPFSLCAVSPPLPVKETADLEGAVTRCTCTCTVMIPMVGFINAEVLEKGCVEEVIVQKKDNSTKPLAGE